MNMLAYMVHIFSKMPLYRLFFYLTNEFMVTEYVFLR